MMETQNVDYELIYEPGKDAAGPMEIFHDIVFLKQTQMIQK